MTNDICYLGMEKTTISLLRYKLSVGQFDIIYLGDCSKTIDYYTFKSTPGLVLPFTVVPLVSSVDSYDPTRALTQETHVRCVSSVTPLNAEVGSSLMSLMTIGKGLLRIVSPFQKSSGWTSGQNFTQPSDLVNTSLGLSVPSM